MRVHSIAASLASAAVRVHISRMRLWIPLILLAALTQCSSPPPAPPPPAPAPPRVTAAPLALTPVQPKGANWEDWPLTPGDWTYSRDARGSIAKFGQVGADADFTVRCVSDGRRMFLSRPGNVSSDDVRMTLRASSALQTYPLGNSSALPPYVAAALSATDKHLDALAFSRGRFLVSVTGMPDLVIPAWPELARVVEDCRG